MTLLYLVRHGETEWSLSGQHTGRTDIPLTDNGREQARKLAPALEKIRFDQVFCSPLSRALETCKLAGLGDQAQTLQELREWDYGIYEGRTTHDIRATEPTWSVWDANIPDGEDAAQIERRAMGVVQRLKDAPGRTAIFSHAYFLRVLARCWISGQARLGAHLVLDTASVSVLGYDRETPEIRQWNLRP